MVNIHDTFYRQHLYTTALDSGLVEPSLPPVPYCAPATEHAAATVASMAECMHRLESALQADAPPCSVAVCAASVYASICVGFLFAVTLLLLAWLLHSLC